MFLDKLTAFVAPLAGAWIETWLKNTLIIAALVSRPSRARGLKRAYGDRLSIKANVAPLAGAWIETITIDKKKESHLVAPLAGAWIETPVFVC